MSLAKKFDTLDTVAMKVGALPSFRPMCSITR